MKSPKKIPPAKAKPTPPQLASLDLDPDAWPKFEALVKSAAKAGHKPHASTSPKMRNRQRPKSEVGR